ncbi:MAG: phage baseplate upper protein, partial [Tetragenococcus koreensis]|nr:phage baseplate upper protein [Tetragenococcus koreensis]
MLRKIAEIKVPTGAGAREARTEPVFASYDRQGAAFAFYFSDSIVAGTKANLLFVIDGQKVFVDDDVTLGETNETHTFTYPLPDELLNYTGKIDGYLYFDFEDGSHSDEIHFVFTIKKSKIDEEMEEAPDVYIKSFEDIKAEVQEAADGAKETISQKVTEVSDTSDSAISKVNQAADDTIKTADQAQGDIQTSV